MKLVKEEGVFYIKKDGLTLERIKPHPKESVIDYKQRAERYLAAYSRDDKPMMKQFDDLVNTNYETGVAKGYY